MNELRCQIAVLGGSLGGVAAALAATRAGLKVHLFSETPWIGGQLTAQGVCTTDENQWVETVGCTASYSRFRNLVRNYYTGKYRLSSLGNTKHPFNPGDCWVSEGFSVEPKLAVEILREMLKEAGDPDISTSASVVRCLKDRSGHIIEAVEIYLADTDETVRVIADYYLDATDLGDVLPLAGVDYTIGAESRLDTREPDAPQKAAPEQIQPFTFVFALERRPEGEFHTISRPEAYEALKALQNYRLEDGGIDGMFTDLGLWSYRRFLRSDFFEEPERIPCDLSTINVDSNDFQGDIWPSGDPLRDASTLHLGRLASLGYVYWLQHECPRDGSSTEKGYPNLKLRTDMFDTADGIAPRPYIRESRRMRALTTVIEQDIAVDFTPGPRARLFPDSCGIGHYSIDIHNGPQTESFSLQTHPFQIPLGALISEKVINLLAASKNLGVTHLTNGAYRVHPVEWNVGESSGALAAFCVTRNINPRDVHDSAKSLKEYQHSHLLAYQRSLLEKGMPLFWWSDVPREHPAFMATQLLGVAQIFPGGSDLLFNPDSRLTTGEKESVEQRIGGPLPWPQGSMTRGEAALWLARYLGLLR